jgi:CubicO group peptidase (beta-lactamase class C family)
LFFLHTASAAEAGPGETIGNLYNDVALEKRIEGAVSKHLAEEPSSMGLVLGVIRGDRSEMAGYGRVSPADNRPPTPKSIFRVASITKTFTGTLLALYLQRHPERHLDDSLQDYVPSGVTVPSYQGRTIELIDLATHTAALPTFPGPTQRTFTSAQLYQYLSGCSLTWKPGERYRYSNFGFGLLALAMVNAEHQVWEKLCVEQIASPLGMPDTRIQLDRSQLARRLTGYASNGAALPIDPPFYPALCGSGGLYSTLTDMMTWMRFNLGEASTPLNSILPVVQQPRRQVNAAGEQIGLAWQMSRPGAPKHLIFKGGDTPAGFHCFMVFDPAHRNGVVVLTNYVNVPSKLADQIIGML